MLTENDVRHVAHLARIAVKDDDVRRYQKELSAVLAYFRELDHVTTEKVAPIAHVTGMKNIFRVDRAVPCDEDTKARIMAAVPEKHDGAIQVHSILS